MINAILMMRDYEREKTITCARCGHTDDLEQVNDTNPAERTFYRDAYCDNDGMIVFGDNIYFCSDKCKMEWINGGA
jgi:hypothetical protein